jgi:hypothetical protein
MIVGFAAFAVCWWLYVAGKGALCALSLVLLSLFDL